MLLPTDQLVIIPVGQLALTVWNAALIPGQSHSSTAARRTHQRCQSLFSKTFFFFGGFLNYLLFCAICFKINLMETQLDDSRKYDPSVS